jgi:hypothetical protein
MSGYRPSLRSVRRRQRQARRCEEQALRRLLARLIPKARRLGTAQGSVRSQRGAVFVALKLTRFDGGGSSHPAACDGRVAGERKE